MNDDEVVITCQHGKRVKILLVMNEQYWDDGSHLEIEGCEECEKENK